MGDVDEQALIPVAEAALALRISTETLRNWIRSGRVPAYGTRSAIRVSIAEIKAGTRYIPELRREPNQRRVYWRRLANAPDRLAGVDKSGDAAAGQ